MFRRYLIFGVLLVSLNGCGNSYGQYGNWLAYSPNLVDSSDSQSCGPGRRAQGLC